LTCQVRLSVVIPLPLFLQTKCYLSEVNTFYFVCLCQIGLYAFDLSAICILEVRLRWIQWPPRLLCQHFCHICNKLGLESQNRARSRRLKLNCRCEAIKSWFYSWKKYICHFMLVTFVNIYSITFFKQSTTCNDSIYCEYIYIILNNKENSTLVNTQNDRHS